MTFEHIATTDFLPMVAAWGSMYALVYAVKKDPKGLQDIESPVKRQKLRQNYFNNHVSVFHAILMCILSKYLNKAILTLC
jgi:hypothetical protein